MNRIVLTTKNASYAIKMRKLLLREGIRSELVKVNPENGLKGCTHGVEISDSESYAAARVLRNAGVSYSIYSEKKHDLS